MTAAPLHDCRVIGSPWPGVYATIITSGRHYGRHSHGTYGFGAVEAGAHRSASGRGIVDAHAGDIVATNPGEVHDGRPLGGPVRRWHTVYLEPAVLAELGAASDLAIARPAFTDPAMRRTSHQLLATLQAWQSGAAEVLACEEALVLAVGRLLAHHSTQNGAPHAADADLSGVRQRLADNLLAPPTLADLALQAGLSRFQLLRRFAAQHGCTPHAWLLQQRAERARALIRRGETLADAATAAGFADQSHMTRIFVRQFGFTPGAWQRAHARLQ